MRHERRRHPRLEIPLETELWLAGSEEETSVTMQDLSAGGAGLLTTTEIPAGTDIDRLRFEMPDGDNVEAQQIEVAARVARCEQQEGLGGEAEFLVGVQFVDITRELFDRIQQFVFRRLRSDHKERVQIERPIAIRFDRFDDFVEEVSVNLSTSGMFIQTRDPRPPGSVFNFQFQLGEDFSLIEGRAEVIWRRRQSEGPEKPPGMGVQFANLDVASQRLIDRLIDQRREAAAAAEVAPPPEPAAPEQVESAPEPAATDLEADEGRAPQSLEQAEAAIVGPGQVNALQETADQLRAELDETRREHEQQLHELRARLEDRQAAASSELDERLRDAEAAHQELDRRRGDLARERDELQNRLDGLQTELAQAREEAGELRRQLDDSTAGEEIQRLTRERAEAGQPQAQLDNRLSEEQAERLSTARDALQATNERLLADLDRANGKADELRRQLDDRARGETRLQGELESARNEIDRLQRSTEATVLQLRADHSAALEAAASAVQEEEAAAAGRDAAAQLEGLRQELTAAGERTESLERELDSARQELEEARVGAAEEAREAAAALAVARDESERLRGDTGAAEESRRTIESELQQVRAEARQAALHAEERQISLRAEAENAILAAAGGRPPPVAAWRSGRRTIAGVALLLIGALLGTLAVTLFEPLGSLAARLRPGAERTALSARPPTPDNAAPEPPPIVTPPSAEPAPGATIGDPVAVAVPAVPEPVPETQPGPDPATAEQAIRDWAAAWSDQRVDDYLASYADSFRPPDGQSRASWAASRRQRITRPRSIEVGVEAARTVELGNDRVSVSFDQTYRSDAFSDQVRKTLLMVWQDGAWRIAEERVIE